MIVFVFMLVLVNVFVNMFTNVVVFMLVFVNVFVNVSMLVFATMVGNVRGCVHARVRDGGAQYRVSYVPMPQCHRGMNQRSTEE